MPTPRELRRAARASLKGQWATAILITLLALLIGVYLPPGPLPGLSASTLEWLRDPGLSPNWRELLSPDIRAVRAFLYFLLGAPGILGSSACYLQMARQQPCRARDLFQCFPQIAPAILFRLLRAVYTFLGLGCFLLPGIYIRYTYALTPYLMAEHPELGVRRAMLASKRAMAGNRMRMLLLDLSFLGWLLLSALSMGTGLLLLIPYHSAARARFYLELDIDPETL